MASVRDKAREAEGRYRESHRDELRARNRAYRESHADLVHAKDRAYRGANGDKCREAVRRWRNVNREKWLLSARQGRAARRAKTTNVIENILVWERCGGRCFCGEEVSFFSMHLDHIVPLSRGGTHSYDNVRAAHPDCNLWKASRLDTELEECHGLC